MNACQNCDWRGPDEEMDIISRLAARVEPGESMPSGQCPQCGALCQREDDIHELFRRVKDHPDYVFGTIFVLGDFPNETLPEDFPAGKAEDQLAETGNTLIFDLVGNPEQED